MNKKTGQVITAVIRNVRLHQEERKIQGEPFGTYTSNYVAQLEDQSEGIMVVDGIAQTLHPDWKNKTASRAATLSSELRGRKIQCKVVEVVGDSYECEFMKLKNN